MLSSTQLNSHTVRRSNYMNETSSIGKQFEHFNNLLIGLTTGLLSFLLHVAFNTDFHLYTCIVRTLALSTTIITFISLVFGVWLAWKRIEHYRMIERHRKLSESDKKDHLQKLLASELEQRKFLKYQGFTFLLASLNLLTIIFIVVLQSKSVAP